jgi:hypothetical protein
VRTDHAGKDGGKKHGQRGSSAKNDDVDIVYRLDKTDDGLMLVRTHTRISWVPEKIDLIVEEFDDITTIRQRTRATKGWTVQEITLAKHLDTLGIPKNAGVNEAQRIAKELGAKLGRKSVLSRAIQCRQLPTSDPLESGTTLGNHPLDPMVAMGTTHRTDRYGVVPARSDALETIEDFDQDPNW